MRNRKKLESVRGINHIRDDYRREKSIGSIWASVYHTKQVVVNMTEMTKQERMYINSFLEHNFIDGWSIPEHKFWIDRMVADNVSGWLELLLLRYNVVHLGFEHSDDCTFDRSPPFWFYTMTDDAKEVYSYLLL